MAGRKRVYARAFPTWGAKGKRSKRMKRTVVRRRRSRRTSNFTSQSGAVRGLGFAKRRRITGAQYRRHLFNGSQFKAHYRSILTEAAGLSTPATIGTGSVARVRAFNSNNVFYTAAGGAVPIDSTVPVPIFQDDIVVRGGRIGLKLTAPPTETVVCKVWLVWTVAEPSLTLIPPSATTSWDPTCVPAFRDKVGRIVMYREVLIEPSDTASFEWRLRPFKYDKESFLFQGNEFQWLVLFYNTYDANAVEVMFIKDFNLSFSGDVVTPGA